MTLATTRPPAAPAQTRSTSPLTTYVDGAPHDVTYDGRSLMVRNRTSGSQSQWKLDGTGDGLVLAQVEGEASSATPHVLAALEAAFAHHPGSKALTLAGADLFDELAHAGVLLPAEDGSARAYCELLWQQPRLWLPNVHTPMAQQFVLTHGKYHPRRPPKPRGTLYQRFIPWLGKTFSFRSIDFERDLPLFNRWMNDPDVAKIWEEEGDLDKHRAYLTAIDRDPHMYSMIASFDGEPFAYFEMYWAKESRIAPFYDVQDYDRGWHVLVGDPAFRGKAYATAWLTSISHYIFLCDPRTQRAVGEPRIDHVQQIRNLDKSGYAKLKEFNLPHKRAQLVVMLREHYFCDALWLPRAPEAAAHGA
ncbi:GNAT family N-acetyltransferase [Variovorax paradoxus]|uniref:GNAT family N-acetyltransferase n=1 Tax=Variovorax paradoxus TaxID=34073 RepID=UPI0027875BEF|nr:GNAT family N-acetyltransferase [Variovorax paradoxus]MDQ0590041.1 acetyl CoA:N6-hydroxylysine acetyl transferase [Variovorax paradoxus]